MHTALSSSSKKLRILCCLTSARFFLEDVNDCGVQPNPLSKIHEQKRHRIYLLFFNGKEEENTKSNTFFGSHSIIITSRESSRKCSMESSSPFFVSNLLLPVRKCAEETRGLRHRFLLTAGEFFLTLDRCTVEHQILFVYIHALLYFLLSLCFFFFAPLFSARGVEGEKEGMILSLA